MPEVNILDFIDSVPLPPNLVTYSGRSVLVELKLDKNGQVKLKNRINGTVSFTGFRSHKSQKREPQWWGGYTSWEDEKSWRDDIAISLSPGQTHTIDLNTTVKKLYRRYSSMSLTLDNVAGTDEKGEEYWLGAETRPELSWEYFTSQLLDYWWIFLIIIIIIVILIAVVAVI